ncbi:hypothetical protein [Alteromonas lipolytica]|uniref:Right handed beta helix domain-containing protein n=1 Tax=Alteromonas lipolytica TaxID=1856405 RepID=A0A1E8FDM9_9ALTE|nr:hypothetical protein [Alteromonas lipolytica]OFI33866.1 hypothetical protein BFC17_20065 [Alteromonas lipolytica]GGF67665.1 hypothetical protein GCM10011338_19860 [Alteromonas lipolytica]
MKELIFNSDYDSETPTLIDGERLLLDKELVINLKHNESLNFNIKKIRKKNEKSKIIFRSELKLIGSLSDVVAGTSIIELSNENIRKGSYIVIEGLIVHENYVPSRLTSAKICCQIKNINQGQLQLDREIPFSLIEVVAYEVPTCSLNFSGHLEDISVHIENITHLNLDLKFTGSIKDRGVLVNIDTCSELKGEIDFKSCNCMIGIALNNVSSGFCEISQTNTGAAYSDSKVVRANALINFSISYWGKHAIFRDIGIHGARNVTMNVNSSQGGSELFERKDNSANRLETVVLAECQHVNLYANIDEANDQGLELISCNDINIYGRISNSKKTESTEGALIIKGESKDITVEALVYAYQSRAIKVECSRGAKNIIFTENTFAFSNDNEAISIRDSNEPYDTNIEIYGTYKAATPISVRKFSDGCTIDAIVDMSFAEVGVVIQSPVRIIEIEAIETSENKQLLSIGGSCNKYVFGSISGDSPECYIQLNSDARHYFNFKITKQLNCQVMIAGDSTIITFVNGIPYSNTPPKFGNYEIGDMFIKKNGPIENIISSHYKEYSVFIGSTWL